MSYYLPNNNKPEHEQFQVNELLNEYASNQNLASTPELHSLFWPSLLNCKNNIQNIFHIKLQIKEHKLQAKQINSIHKYDQINSEINPHIKNVGKWTVDHPKAQEILDSDVKKFDLINLLLILKRYVSLSHQSIETITKDTNNCIEKVIKNYENYLLAKKQALNEDNLAWCPKQFQEKIIGVTDNNENQIKIFIGALSVYKQSLLDRYNKLAILDVLEFDLSTSYVFQNDISALHKLYEENRHYQKIQRFNELEHEIDTKIKGIYLNIDDNEINLNKSLSFIKTRRTAVLQLIESTHTNLKQMNLQTLKNKLRSAICKQKQKQSILTATESQMNSIAKETTKLLNFGFSFEPHQNNNIQNKSKPKSDFHIIDERNISIESKGHSLLDHFHFKTLKEIQKEDLRLYN